MYGGLVQRADRKALQIYQDQKTRRETWGWLGTEQGTRLYVWGHCESLPYNTHMHTHFTPTHTHINYDFSSLE